MSKVATPQPLRRLRAGIVGGGRGAFIGSVHRIAAELDGQAQIIAGAMSSHPEIARESAAAWFLERAYTSYADMASSEAADREGIDFVIIATPNDLHYPVARAFLTAGIHVVCDKPLALRPARPCSRSHTTTRAIPPCARRVRWCVAGSWARYARSWSNTPRTG